MRRHDIHRDEIDRAFDARLSEALIEYVRKQEAFAEQISSYPRWAIDHDKLTLTFEDSVRPSMVTSIIPIATYLPRERNWAWVWANDSYPHQAREASSRIKELSELTGYAIFVSPFFPVTPAEIDELCALSLGHLGGRGVFKIKDEEPWRFLVVE